MTAPIITPCLEDSGLFRLYARTRFGLDVAGPRLFRAPPFPEVAWESDTEDEANAQARTLQLYLNDVYARRGPSKTKLREQGD